jgi:hypothetical protein
MTTITNPRDARIQAIFIRAHLRMLAAGMKNSRLSGTQILKAVSSITGHVYKRGQYAIALEDLNRIINE